MRNRLVGLGAAAVLAAATLTGCAAVPLGPTVVERHEIEDVTAVELNSAGDLSITEGEPSLTIHAPQGIIDILTVEVRDGVLELGRRPGAITYSGDQVRYDLTVRDLTSIEVDGSGDVVSSVSGENLTIAIRGSGDVEVEGVDAESVEITIDGSGDVELSGRADTLTVDVDGSGDIDTEDLETREADVSISGSGDASVNVTEILRVTIDGVGSVRYRGGAEVESDIDGVGEVVEDD